MPQTPPSPPPLLRVSHLTRSFASLKAVNDLSFDIHPGSCIGLIGANGAGKTTLLRCLATLDLPDSGSISINEIDAIAHPNRVRDLIGWMPDAMDMWPQTTVSDYLDFVARVNGFKGKNRHELVDYWVDFCHLAPLKSRFINKLSKGESQRLGLARMLIANPRLLLMDEPAAGLDPQARAQFKQSMQQLLAQGRTLLISSHILSELAEMCDHLLLLDAGKLIYSGSSQDLLLLVQSQSSGIPMRLRPLHLPADLVLRLQEDPAWSQIALEGDWVKALFSGSDGELAAALSRVMEQQALLEFSRTSMSLEEGFISFLKLQNAAAAPAAAAPAPTPNPAPLS